MKIVVLHGFLETGDHMKMKTGELRKLAPKTAEFVYPDAPMEIFADERTITGEFASGTAYSVPNNMRITEAPGNRFGYLLTRGDEILGLQESISFVEQQIQDSDLTVAFSEAATVCLMALNEGRIADKRIILVAPYVYQEYLPETVDNIIVMQGLSDEVVKTEGYYYLKQRFPNLKTVEHSAGHFINCGGELKEFWKSQFEKADQ